MQLVESVELSPTPQPPGAPGRRATTQLPTPNIAELELDLAPQEDAVLLMEQDGVYSWRYASKVEPLPAQRTRGGVQTREAIRRVTFQVELPSGAAAPRRSGRRGLADGFIYGKVRAFVLKFAARIAVGGVVKFLERHISEGIVKIDSLDPKLWKPVQDLSALALPAGRPARILLLIHGTFSSTTGGYGSLTATPWGRRLLEAAWATYDAVIGFDHPTLSENPLVNATALLSRLQGHRWNYPPHFDVVAHSRGGLVFRSLVEHLLPLSNWQAHFDRVVFVACTNNGTQLAKPENWHNLADLYTNLAVGACRALGMIPQAKGVTLVMGEMIKGLGAFVKYCATQAVTESGVPGLAAMAPGGDFVTKINEAQPGQPTPEKSSYYAITSEFEPRLINGDREPKEMPSRLLQWVADVLMDQLMQSPNDLVVDTPSMTHIDPQLGNFIKDTLSFGKNPRVYHSNYFTQPEVTNALARWLHLVEPTATATRSAARRGGTRKVSPQGERSEARVSASKKLGGGHATVGLGSTVGPSVPAAVDTSILVVPADMPISECIELLEEESPNYAVVHREPQELYYAFTPEELVAAVGEEDVVTDVGSAMGLHEGDASHRRSVGGPMEPPQAGGPPTRGRAVVFDKGRPIGVLSSSLEPLAAAELTRIARVVTKAAPEMGPERFKARRSMLRVPKNGGALLEAAPPRAANGGAATEKVTCHFHAEMDDEVIVQRVTTTEVVVSRELIGRATGVAAGAGQAQIDPLRKLIVQVIPKENFEVVGEDRVEMDPPEPGHPQNLYFDVRPTHLGDGEVWVIARQGQVSLVTLALKPRVVQAITASRRRASAEATTPEAPRLAEPLHQLLIFEMRNGADVSFQYHIQSPALGILESFNSGPITGNRQQYVEGLYKEIEDRWVSNKDDVQAFAADVRAFGGQLFDQLFPEKLRRILWDHRDRIGSIMVISTEPSIPWEIAHLKEPDKRQLPGETRFLGQMGLVRWLHGSWPPDQLKIRTGRARYVIPKYPHPDYELPEAELEYKFLNERFSATPVEPQPNPVRELVSQPGGFDLLHFACHGAADIDNISNAKVMLQGRIEDGKYVPAYLSATAVEQFSNLKAPDNRPMVVLNACQTGRAGYSLTGMGGFAQAFLGGGAGAFIGTLWSVGDHPARTFTESLYSELLKGSNLSEAAIQARERARQAGDATWLAYAVYGHPHMKIAG